MNRKLYALLALLLSFVLVLSACALGSDKERQHIAG